MKQILHYLLIIMVVAIVGFSFTEGIGGAVILVFTSVVAGLTTGTIQGIPLIISIYGTPAILGVVASLVAIIAGIIKRNHLAGQIAAVIGIASWILLAVYGMGHGG